MAVGGDDHETPQEISERLVRAATAAIVEAAKFKKSVKSYGKYTVVLNFKSGLIDMVEAGDLVIHR